MSLDVEIAKLSNERHLLRVRRADSSAEEVELETRASLHGVRSTRERTRALLDLLPPLITRATARAEVHRGARKNGKGGHGHDLVFGG